MPETDSIRKKIGIAAAVLLFLFLLGLMLSVIIGIFMEDFESGNVAVVKVEGALATTGSGFFGSDLAVSEDIVKLIKKADKNPEIKAIIIEIDSPGGSAVASDEIGNAIKKANKTTVAVIREAGASGGYWIASSADHVIANRMSITGSIGVIASYLDFSGLIQRYNISYERLVAGKYKDIGTPLRDLSPEERAMMQEFLDQIHDEFMKEVAQNRNMPVEDVRKIATGMFYTGRKAKDLGLVDELGGMDEARQYIEKNLNITADIVEYKKSVRLSDILAGVLSRQSFTVGEGIGNALITGTEGRGVLS